ncbi:RlpA-like double-psi beta-barrel-protein domain-containing protein-containing protein [Syncephalis plumigaleata]|nr:RlpA-like double-psi beta-barrel-protein domain-containing protein-containing protein [Syncephalis plumigaleata]
MYISTITSKITLIALVAMTAVILNGGGHSVAASSFEMKKRNNNVVSSSDSNAPPSSLAKRGDGTFYNMEGGYTACGEQHKDSEFYAAVAPSWFTTGNPNSDPICKKCALVSGPKGQVKVHINDVCPPCARDSIDMTPAAFNQIADPSQGRVPISWDFTEC